MILPFFLNASKVNFPNPFSVIRLYSSVLPTLHASNNHVSFDVLTLVYVFSSFPLFISKGVALSNGFQPNCTSVPWDNRRAPRTESAAKRTLPGL